MPWGSYCESYVTLFKISEDLSIIRKDVEAERLRQDKTEPPSGHQRIGAANLGLALTQRLRRDLLTSMYGGNCTCRIFSATGTG